MTSETLQTKRLSSSLRFRSAEDSLVIAKQLAFSRGVSRVVDTTWLDKIGIPVYSSIRPDGVRGSLCVSAGKGFTHTEAKIGAYMEAIELSFAEPGRSAISWTMENPESILASFKDGIHFSDFGALAGSQVQSADYFAAVTGQEIKKNLGPVLVPAELVYVPFRNNPGPSIYGTSSNGLASGNTIEEATVHGLAEVLERDVTSFNRVKERSMLVEIDDAPPKIKQLLDKINAAGLSCRLRYVSNVYGMAYFVANVLEEDEHCAVAVATGIGFHPIREIAAVRAITEAVQSRLSHIHGGRDDIIKDFVVAAEIGPDAHLSRLRELRERINDATNSISYHEIPDFDNEIGSIPDALHCLYAGLDRAGLGHVVRIVFTEPDYPFQVVRTIVPGAELFDSSLKRVGPRILAYSQNAN